MMIQHLHQLVLLLMWLSRNSNLTILVEALQRTDLVEARFKNDLANCIWLLTNQAFQNF